MSKPSAVKVTQTIHHLELQLQRRLRSYVRDLRLLPRADGLVLRGQSRNYFSKQVAQEAVMEATPVPLVANEIVVA
jgi:hypothetical protein